MLTNLEEAQRQARIREIKALRAVLEDMRLADVGGTLRIGVLAHDGAASAEISGLHQEVFRAWWERRKAALAFGQSEDEFSIRREARAVRK